MLSQVGARLKEQLPEFSPSAYGYERLKDLLGAHHSVGRLERADHDFWFVAHPQRLRRHWWLAATTVPHWYDLDTSRVVRSEDLVAAEPERYVAIPSWDDESERALAREWSLRWENSDELLELLDNESSIHVFLDHVRQQPRVSSSWKDERLNAIRMRILAWAEQHEIPAATILDTPRAQPQARPHVAVDRIDEGDHATTAFGLRRRLHEVVDRMTVSEMLELRVPTRFLLDVD